MPELPDVSGFKAYIEQNGLNRGIASISVHDERFVKNCSLEQFESALEGNQFTAIRQRGKFLFVALETGQWIVLHFGMTGEPVCYQPRDNPPRFERLTIEFVDRSRLGIACMRMLGYVTLASDPDAFIGQEKLGPHALAADFRQNDFVNTFTNRRGAIKSALMNQALIAGIGNIYADEILFHAGVHPETKTNALSEETLKRLFQVMQEILKTASNVGGDPERVPDRWLLPHRGKKSIQCPECTTEIAYKKVSGRGSYFCPKCQPTD